ncbi:MAG: hydrogenase accessory protein HypB [Myxococcales bacterium 68-20]|nr:MAG: hydrogenase accessory protein HypB [Myxococcales bacterium 68-20]
MMCTSCGCGGESGHVLVHEHDDDDDDRGPRPGVGYGWGREVRTVHIERELLAKNNQIATRTRRLLSDIDVTMINLIGAPEAGKTSLVEATLRRLRGDDVQLVVIEGDQTSDVDAKRIERAGGRVLQINTGPGCHLDASMVADGLSAMAPRPRSVVVVENVGNLVCPALYDLGERAKVVVMSVTEGEDEPLKYAHVFRAAELLVLSKTDLAPHVAFDDARCIANVRRVNPRLRVLPVSVVHEDGLDEWCDWLVR